ncbi:hypothetical protein [Streptomyces sp. NBC_01235]|uniref:hypothetical protein n=1 Tax=Streptomyces sp. NBC_01235 TaxID=2903788 RepID=UPI002E11EA06|nr:hypothetical protein OG289_01555 [Streptomyces sp. NBC_01235]
MTAVPAVRHGWHKLLIGLVLLGRATRIPAAMDGMSGSSPSGWWNVLWEVLALVLAAFAVSEWEILQATSWRMPVSQWICMVIFHVGLIGFLAALVIQLL